MNLLLLLSALLSAITGVNASSERAPFAAEQVARTTQVAAAAAAQIAVHVPRQPIAVTAALRMVEPLLRVALPARPLYASRRRE